MFPHGKELSIPGASKSDDIMFMSSQFKGPWEKLFNMQELLNMAAVIPSATALPLIYWRMVTTFALYRNCSGIKMSKLR